MPNPAMQTPLHVLDLYLKSAAQRTETMNPDEVLRVADALFGSTTADGAMSVLDAADTMITRVVAPGDDSRTLHLVKASSRKHQESMPNYYLCIFPLANNHADNIMPYYCSCRSFLDRSSHSRHVICKHLLALKLMVPLQVSCATLPAASHAEFAKIITTRLALP